MSDANVLSSLKKYEKLTDVQVIGKVRCLIEKPSIISTLTKREGYFAIVDVYALKCLGRDYFGEDSGYYDKDRIYFSCGSLVFCLTDAGMVGKLVKIGSKSNISGTIKKQTYVRDPRSGLHCFAFRRDKDGSWCIAPNVVRYLTNNDVSGTVLEDYIKLDNEGNELEEFVFPESTQSIIEYSGVTEYQEIKLEEQKKEPQTINGVVQPAGRSVSVAYTDDGMVDVSKIDLHLVKHLKAQNRSELLDVVEEEVNLLNERMVKTSTVLCDELISLEEKIRNATDIDIDEEDESDVIFAIASDIRNTYISVFAGNYDIPFSSRVKVKGKDFVDPLISSLYDVRFADTDERLSDEKKKMQTEGVDRIKKGVAFNPYVLSSDFGDVVPVLGSDVKMASLIVGNVTGIGEQNIVKNFNSCKRHYNLDLNYWFRALMFRPYTLAMLGNGLNVVDCDNIFLTFTSVFYDRYLYDDVVEEEFEANMQIRNKLMILEGIRKEEVAYSNTLVSINRMKSKYFKFYPDKASTLFKDNGFPMKYINVEAVRKLLNVDFSVKDCNEFIGKNPCSDKLITEMMNEMGIIDMVNDKYLAMSKNMYKEFFIYKTLIEKGEAETGITDYEVQKAITEFEKEKGFSLESLQKEGIGLTKYKAAVLSGCAGSGKTTTSDCMSMVLEKNLKGYEIVYGTPTGKACRRLAEVVGGNVKTLHSLFGVGVDSEPYLVPPKQRVNFSSRCIYLLDEMAMCSTDLLYEVVKSLSNSDIIYFLGDIKQLPPIGRGIPFSMLMRILPCVELGVSKRAASGSLVNYNCLLINFLSDSNVVNLKFDNDTFVGVDCDDEMIPSKTCKMFQDLMSGVYGGKKYAEDEIQVITEYQDPKKSWAAPVLNPPIQEFLRRDDKLLFQNTDRKFYQNDRVIHVKRNSYEMKRYERVSGTTLREVVTFGAVNGEVGKLIGICRSDMVTLIPFDSEEYKKEIKGDKTKEKLLERWEEKCDDLRDDTAFSDESFYFVMVQYYDTDLHKDVIVLYRTHCKSTSGFVMDEMKYLEGKDLGNLELAYALTAHKMQGSQSKAVIAVFGKGCSPQFVNRNMINVIITRSQEFVGLIGSVTGEGSAIERGRVNVSPSKRDDILGVLAGEVELS